MWRARENAGRGTGKGWRPRDHLCCPSPPPPPPFFPNVISNPQKVHKENHKRIKPKRDNPESNHETPAAENHRLGRKTARTHLVLNHFELLRHFIQQLEQLALLRVDQRAHLADRALHKHATDEAEAAPVGVQRLELLQHEHVVLQLAVQLVDLAPHRRRLPLLLVEPLRHDLHLLRGHVVGGLRHVCASKRAALVPRIYRLGKKKNTRCTSCTTLFEKSVYLLRCRNILSKTLGDWVSSELCCCSGFDRVRRNLTHYRVPPPPPAPPPHRPPAQHLPDRADRKESPKGYLSKIKKNVVP